MWQTLYNIEPRKLINATVIAVCLQVFGLLLISVQPVVAIKKIDRQAVVNDTVHYEECGLDGTTGDGASEGSVTGRIYILGDSIAEGTAADLDGTLQATGFNEVVVNAKASRRLTEGTTDLDGITVLAGDKAQYSSASAIVIQLGTNGLGNVTAANIQKTLDIIKQATTTAKIYWVNIGVDNTRRSEPPLDPNPANAALQQNSGLGYTVIDWATAIKQHPEYIDPNPATSLGVHPAGAGKQGFAATIATAVAGATTSPGAQTVSTNSCVCQVSSTSAALVGSDNAEKTYNFLIGKGLTPPQAAGVMGNLQAESGFNPGIVERSGGGGYGIAQWTGGRRTQLEDAAKAKGVPVNDLGFQLDYLYEEAVARGDWDKLKLEIDVRGATLSWHKNFERSADDASKLERRVQFGTDLLARYGSSSGASFAAGSGSCTTASNGVVNGLFGLPVDRKYYDQHPSWFTAPHHDYPAVDLPVSTGTPVYAVAAGTIVSAPTNGDCGTGVEIDIGDGIRMTYCHGTDGGAVDGAKQGDKVQAGQLIMHSGATGHVTGPHLHFAIKVNGNEVCPQSFLVGIATGQVPDIKSLPTSGCTE